MPVRKGAAATLTTACKAEAAKLHCQFAKVNLLVWPLPATSETAKLVPASTTRRGCEADPRKPGQKLHRRLLQVNAEAARQFTVKADHCQLAQVGLLG